MLTINTRVFLIAGDHRGEYGTVITLPISRDSELYIIKLDSGTGLLIGRAALEPVQLAEAKEGQ